MLTEVDDKHQDEMMDTLPVQGPGIEERQARDEMTTAFEQAESLLAALTRAEKVQLV